MCARSVCFSQLRPTLAGSLRGTAQKGEDDVVRRVVCFDVSSIDPCGMSRWPIGVIDSDSVCDSYDAVRHVR